MLLEKMFSEVRVPGVFLVEIIADTPWELELINDAMSFAASWLEGGVAIRKGCAHMHNLHVLFFSSTLVGLMDTVSVKKWIMSWATLKPTGCGGGGSRAGVLTGERFGGGPDALDTSSSSSSSPIPSRLNSSSLESS
jgi:hypothetical protein